MQQLNLFSVKPVENVETIADVTYKEVMRIWKLPKWSAIRRLNDIRGNLDKKRRHKLTVDQFCKEEDISSTEFYQLLYS